MGKKFDIECPQCGGSRIVMCGTWEVECFVEDDCWEPWEGYDAAEVHTATCHLCQYVGDPEEFGYGA